MNTIYNIPLIIYLKIQYWTVLTFTVSSKLSFSPGVKAHSSITYCYDEQVQYSLLNELL